MPSVEEAFCQARYGTPSGPGDEALEEANRLLGKPLPDVCLARASVRVGLSEPPGSIISDGGFVFEDLAPMVA